MPVLHVCLVSHRTIRNVLPLMCEQPDRLILIVSPEMNESPVPVRFDRLFADTDLAIETYPGAPGTTMTLLQENAIALCEYLEETYDGWEVVLNLSEGTKLMTLAYLEAMRHLLGKRFRAIYCDLTDHEIDVIVPRAQPSIPLPHLLDVPSYLKSQGVTYRRADSDDSSWVNEADRRKVITKKLGSASPSIQGVISTLNWLSNRALTTDRKRLAIPTIKLGRMPRGSSAKLLGLAADLDLIEWTGTRKVTFANTDSARFLGGGWLEEYTWHIARDENPDDVRAGVAGTWDDVSKQAPRNELDMLVVHHNRLLIVECKTSRVDLPGNPTADALYKLDSLTNNLGGLYGSALMISARSPSQDQINRARQQNIELVFGSEIGSLREFFLRWMAGGPEGS